MIKGQTMNNLENYKGLDSFNIEHLFPITNINSPTTKKKL